MPLTWAFPENDPHPTDPVGERDPRDPIEGEYHAACHHHRRERRPVPGGLRHQGRRQASRCTARMARPCSATRPRSIGSGPCSTGMNRAGRLRVRPRGSADPQAAGHLGKPQSARCSARTGRRRGGPMTSTIDRPARVGVITDQTGALSFMGIANVNVAKMVIDDINSRGGLLGRPVELFVEDSATDDEVAAAVARPTRGRRRGRRRGRDLQLDAPSHQGPRGRRGRQALHLPRAVRGAGIPSADLLHRSRAGPAGRAVLPVADGGDGRDRGSTCRRPTTSGRTR